MAGTRLAGTRPAGPEDFLKQDADAADARRRDEPSDYLPLRPYQQDAVQTIVDHDAFEHGHFKAKGGFTLLNKVCDGKLDEILGEIGDALCQVAA